MRAVLTSILALGLLIILCASGQAAAWHHARARHVHVHRQDVIRSFNRSQDAVPGFTDPARAGKPIWPPVLEDQTPAYDDPSKFGGD